MSDEEIALSFNELPLETRKYLSKLSPEEIEAQEDIAKLAKDLRAVGRVVKWLVVSILGFAVGVAMLGDSIFKIISWFKVAPPA